MPTYTIVIKNHSGSNQNYLLFQAPPLKANPIGQVWSNVWVKTDGTPSPNGRQVITVTEDLFAFAGTTPKSLADGVTVSESDYAGPVTLANGSVGGTKPTVSIVNDNPAFGPKPYSTTNKPNSFGITVKPYDVGAYPHVVVGMGKYNSGMEVVPALTWAAPPNTEIDITPDATYYVATGSYKTGAVLDITTYGAAVGIPFATAPAGWTVATVTQLADGTYKGPESSKPPGQKLAIDEKEFRE